MADLHQQMNRLRSQVAELETRLGEVSGELAELNSVAGSFIARYQAEVLRFHNALLAVQREIADLRAIKGDRSAHSADEVSSPLNRYLVEDRSVQAQFDRAWGGPPPKVTGPEDLPPTSDKLRQLYTEIVVQVHPDLAHSRSKRTQHWEIMYKADEAYAQRDEAALQTIASTLGPRSSVPSTVDEQAISQLLERVGKLETLTNKIEGVCFEVRYGDIARLRLHSAYAQREGRDFLAELGGEIRARLRQAHEELSELKT